LLQIFRPNPLISPAGNLVEPHKIAIRVVCQAVRAEKTIDHSLWYFQVNGVHRDEIPNSWKDLLNGGNSLIAQ
jgi:hypothetical protein